MVPNWLNNNSDALLRLGMGLLAGQTGSQQAAMGLQGFTDARASAKEQALAAQKQNQTIEFMRRVAPELAQAVDAGIMSPADAYKHHLTTQKPESPKATDDMREYEFAKTQGYGGSFFDYQQDMRKSGATTINMPGQPMIGTIPQGWEAIKDEKTGAFSMRPVAGGPAAIEAENAARQKQIGQDSKARSGNVVIEDIDRALAGLGKGMLPTAGMVGGALANVPGTQAYDVGALIQTIKANSGFDRLQAMRDSSPTGGALGAINQSEMALLQSALGNLEQSQSEEQLRYNLQRVRQIYDAIVNGPAGGGAMKAPTGNTTSSGISWSIE